MPMIIATNVAALSTNKAFNRNSENVGATMRRLSSGMRINSAKDDAAGLAITERMTTQVRGLTVARRNMNDGISLLQTAEGGLEEVAGMLQRMRELSVQAANTAINAPSERKKLQEEVNQLTAEIDRISKSVEFNGVKLLNGQSKAGAMDTESKVIDALQSGWLETSLTAVERFMGLEASAAKLEVVLDPDYDGAGNIAAFVQTFSQTSLRLTLDMQDFNDDPSTKNGGSPAYYNDRIIAHEMVHAVMGNRIAGFGGLDTWFTEGVAEFIHGADERVAGHGIAAVMGDNDLLTWDDNGDVSIDYASGYLAVRYIHSKAGGYDPENPDRSGIGQVLNLLENGSTLLNAINQATGEGYANMTAFRDDFVANGQTYLEANGLDLTNDDTGAIGGRDAENGGYYRDTDAEQVIYDIHKWEKNPTVWDIDLPKEAIYNEGAGEHIFNMQVGANEGEIIRIGTGTVGSKQLRIDDLDLVDYAAHAIGTLDTAINFVSKQRARFGAQMSRMESAVRNNETKTENTSASRSRIKDSDYAIETSELTRSLIVSQAATAMTAQAQAQPELVLSLLQ